MSFSEEIFNDHMLAVYIFCFIDDESRLNHRNLGISKWSFLRLQKRVNSFAERYLAAPTRATTPHLRKILQVYIKSEVYKKNKKSSRNNPAPTAAPLNKEKKQEQKKSDYRMDAAEFVLKKMNEITGSKYRISSKDTVKKILALLVKKPETDDTNFDKELFTAFAMVDVIRMKNLEWADGKMRKYLRPATIFARSNFIRYYEEFYNYWPVTRHWIRKGRAVLNEKGTLSVPKEDQAAAYKWIKENDPEHYKSLLK